MSAPRTKRQFAGAASDPAQRQITSFFNPSSTNTNAAAASPNYGQALQSSSALPTTHRPDSATTPEIPASVQANLLSVGMRVRKSVPEGYKTGSYGVFALWDEGDADVSAKMGEGQRSRANAFSAPRELLPFCGIHRVGGLDTQPDTDRRYPLPNNMYTTAGPATPVRQPGLGGGAYDHEMPGLTSSQDTVDSDGSLAATTALFLEPPTTTGASRTRKRFFVEDEDDQAPAQLNLWRYAQNSSAGPGTPRGMSYNGNGNNNNGDRAVAVPRKGRLRAKFSGAAAAAAMAGAGQENRMAVDNDFGEAEFLERGTWEVDMSDA
ncbi:putative ribonucleotide reductase inhibitor [Rosellinia necatrix]|uniref:Putative ribonucleotide reductase inhibitor n=1 Tax=Rosellinia necatrix TaxID=77044 RepID=A0A1W2TEX3_ROSNE|nr:putative ribonucleotide reductase inhibitor [Rosellinia necatrix]